MNDRPLKEEKSKTNLDAENEIGKQIVDATFQIHRTLGPGLLESAYQEILFYERQKPGPNVKKEVPIPIIYQTQTIQVGYQIIMLINKTVIVENKTVETLLPIHQAQLLAYMELSGFNSGYLLNRNVVLMKYGIKRMVC
jgi:GxxExxY protein